MVIINYTKTILINGNDFVRGFNLNRGECFTGKAFASIQIETPNKVIAINQNSFGIVNYDHNAIVEELNIPIPVLEYLILQQWRYGHN